MPHGGRKLVGFAKRASAYLPLRKALELRHTLHARIRRRRHSPLAAMPCVFIDLPAATRRRSNKLAATVVVLLTLSRSPLPAEDALRLSDDLRVQVRLGREVELEVQAAAGDDYGSIARRVAGPDVQPGALAAWNGARSLTAGTWARVPVGLLSPPMRSLVLRSLFPKDHLDGQDWIHVARSGVLPVYDEGLWQVAHWFAGRGSAFDELMRVNGLSSPELAAGQRVRIPAALLVPAFQARASSANGALEYGSDAEGPYAIYRLRPGEALYSAVVVRFTGRTAAEDIRALSDQLVQRSHIRDARDIPVGFEIKIPLDLLEEEFLPRDHPRRLEAEARQAELRRELERQPVTRTREGLEGVLVILDPGHGGRDLGTMNHGIWEHDYVYDVACRLKGHLERETSATVLMTLIDAETGCEPSAQDKLVANRQGTLQTTPPFLAREEGDSAVGVNLRWYLANSAYRRAVAQGLNSDRVLFLSLHADSRHPSLRGIMVYVPGAGHRAGTYGENSGPYRKFKEVRERPHVSFPRNERVRSEAVSRKMADAIVEAFRAEGLPLQPYQPVRDKVIRGKQRWLPAVLRGNAVPAKVLVELVNMSNPDDAALLASARRRDQLARTLMLAIYRHFGEKPRRIAAPSRAAP